ncbi:MAG: hypothetical protein M1834_006301 [Cirrosporium novae-zelandiae]|nr:MAG: hypothetical protein M1834_006301 [Cirrosporium novae-zelandiae]
MLYGLKDHGFKIRRRNNDPNMEYYIRLLRKIEVATSFKALPCSRRLRKYCRMAALRSTFSLHSLTTPLHRTTQRRWARVHDVRFLATHPQPDRVLEKYRDKLSRKAKEEGHHDIESLKDAYKDKISSLRHESLRSLRSPGPNLDPLQITSTSTFPSPSPPPPPTPQQQSTTKSHSPAIKTLSSYLDIPKIHALGAKEIEQIWRLRFASNPNSLVATIPADTYYSIACTARQHPRFVLPLPHAKPSSASDFAVKEEEGDKREQQNVGAEIHYLQWTFPTPTTSTVLFTHLAEFQLRGEFAQPHTTITHHIDLAPSHGVVLMEGQVMENRGINADEARWLVMCLQRFYNYSGRAEKEAGKRRRELLERFSEGKVGEGGFKIEELLDEAERIG